MEYLHEAGHCPQPGALLLLGESWIRAEGSRSPGWAVLLASSSCTLVIDPCSAPLGSAAVPTVFSGFFQTNEVQALPPNQRDGAPVAGGQTWWQEMLGWGCFGDSGGPCASFLTRESAQLCRFLVLLCA